MHNNILSDPFDELFPDMAPASEGQLLNLFPNLTSDTFLRGDPVQDYGLMNDFMENLWVGTNNAGTNFGFPEIQM